MPTDLQYMLRALELARQGEGLTRPNPPVGAVLVQNDAVLAEGWHQRAGGPHAEVNCLKAAPAGDLSEATLYVTLEPCSTSGRTPPCTDRILERGIGRVVAAVPDPNPNHAGRGLELLREHGVSVECGVCETEARELIAPFAKRITTGLPYVTLKLAATLDGRIADRNGDSKWITGPAAREAVQALRRRADAVLVGAATVRADDPSLLPRPAEGRRPWRVVVGKDIPPAAQVLTDAAAECTLRRSGELSEILRGLAAEQEVMHVLCEGGGRLAAGLVEEGLVDAFALFFAPKLMGPDGCPMIGGAGRLMPDLQRLKIKLVETLGQDILINATKE